MRRKHSHDERRVACLACGEARVVLGAETGECARCHYVGWAPADELDRTTRSAIMNRAFARHQRAFVLRP